MERQSERQSCACTCRSSRIGPIGVSWFATYSVPRNPARLSAGPTIASASSGVLHRWLRWASTTAVSSGWCSSSSSCGRGAVRQMPARARDPSLHARRVAARPQPDLVVVRLEHEGGEPPEQIADRGGGSAEVVGDAHADAVLVSARRSRAARPRRGSWGSLPPEGPDSSRWPRPIGAVQRIVLARPRHDQVPGAVSTGTPNRRASGAAPREWSPCSWVRAIADQPIQRQAHASGPPLDLAGAEAGVEQQHRPFGLATAKQLPPDPEPSAYSASSGRPPRIHAPERVPLLRR